MGNVINLADRKPKDRNRRSIEIGKLVDLRDSMRHVWEQVSAFYGFKHTGVAEADADASIASCTKWPKALR